MHRKNHSPTKARSHTLIQLRSSQHPANLPSGKDHAQRIATLLGLTHVFIKSSIPEDLQALRRRSLEQGCQKGVTRRG